MTNDILPTKDADEELKRAFTRIFEKLQEPDDTPIAAIHSTGYAEDREAFTVMVDMVDGRELMYTFRPGASVAVKWLNEPAKPATQYARLMPWDPSKTPSTLQQLLQQLLQVSELRQCGGWFLCRRDRRRAQPQ